MHGWTLVFDLDGTLVDTAPDLAAATNHVLARAGFAPVDERSIRPFVGNGARVMIERALAAHGQTAEPADLQAHFDSFIDFYGRNIAVSSRPYPGVLAALEAFSKSGATLAVCTNKTERLAKTLLSELGMLDRFAALTGGDSLGVFKPHPRHLLGTIELAKGDAARAVMIGDSETDIKTAKAAGIPVVAVDFGYSNEPVDTLAPDAIISHYDELASAVAAIRSQQS